nr:unnamed protein product [Callosobruchus chinensis]
MRRASNISQGFKSYFVDSYPATFKFTEYSPLLGVMNEMAYVQAVFIWNYADVLIMLTGTALNFKAKQIAFRVQTLIDIKSADLASWRRVRQDYTRLVDLCNLTNSKMSLSIVFSFTVNLYFMMEQIFKNIQPINGTVQKSYFVISMTLLVVRTFCVIIFSGSVYSEYMEIRYIIHSVSSTAYNKEVNNICKFFIMSGVFLRNHIRKFR